VGAKRLFPRPEASRPRTSDTLRYSTFPSGSLSRLSGRGQPPPPKRCRGPLGWKPQGKPVCPFLRPKARFHHGGYGAPAAASPFVLGQSPPLAHRVFTAASGGLGLRTPRGYSPRLTHPPSSPLPRVRGPGREVPPLDRGTCRLPPSLRPGRTCDALSPYEVPELGVLQARPGFHGPQAGGSEQGGGRTLPVTGLAIVRPRFLPPPSRSRGGGSSGWQALQISLGPLVPHDTLSTGVLRTRDGAMGSPIPWPGLAPGFPRPALGVCPQDPFRVAQPAPLLPKGYVDCGRAGGCAPDAPR
jgi:hypothetical protein